MSGNDPVSKSALVRLGPLLPARTQPRRPPTRLADRLYATLVEQIANGSLSKGQRLRSESELSAEFGVSRPVVREAISRLQAEALVETRHGSGSFVLGVGCSATVRLAPIESTLQLMYFLDLRIALECEAAILAARRRRVADIDFIVSLIDVSEQDGEAAISDADQRFHLEVARISRNAVLEDMIAKLLVHISAGAGTVLQSSSWLIRQAGPLASREHHEILKAIRSQEEEQAYSAMRHHLEKIRSTILDAST